MQVIMIDKYKKLRFAALEIVTPSFESDNNN